MIAALCGSCREDPGQLVVEVDAEAEVLARLRKIEVALLEGDTKLDAVEIIPTGARPTCLPFSVGVAPSEGHEGAAVGVAVTATLRDGSVLTQRTDTHFTPGVRLFAVLFAASCLGASGCDEQVTRELPAVDRAGLEAQIASTPCRTLVTVPDCLSEGGCFRARDPNADPICVLPCPAPFAPADPADPEPTEAPRSVCPPGWSASTSGCEPWPAGATCSSGRVRFPGEAACGALGGACPGEGWPEGLGAGAIYVRPGGPSGDGTRQAPLATLAEALLRAEAGATIGLAAGEHGTPSLALDRPVRIVGACAEGVVLRGRDSVLTVTSTDVALEGLSLEGVALDVSGRGSLRSVRLGAGVTVEGQLAAERVVLEGGDAVVRPGGTLTATAAIVRCPAATIEGRAALADTSIEGTGLAVAGHLALVRGLAEGLPRFAVEGGAGELTDVLVRGSAASASVSVAAGSTLALDRVALRSGAAVDGVLQARDLWIGGSGTGAALSGRGRIALERAELIGFERAVDLASGGSITASHLAARDLAGAAVHLAAGTSAAFDHLEVARAAGDGIALETAAGLPSTLVLRDVVVTDVAATPRNDDGYGLRIGRSQAIYAEHARANVTVSRARFERCHTMAVELNQADVRLDDLTVLDTGVGDDTGSIGLGLHLDSASAVAGRRLRLDGNVDAGLAVRGQPSRGAHLFDVRITNTSCPREHPLCGVYHGTGVAVYLEGYLELERFVLDHNLQNGLQLDFAATADLTNGEVSHSVTGAYVRVGGFDLLRIGERVWYHDNLANLAVGDLGP